MISDQIDVTVYKDAVNYKRKNIRMSILNVDGDVYMISKVLVVVTDEEKSSFVNSVNQCLVYREHSKYAITISQTRLSVEAIHCLNDSLRFHKNLINSSKK